MSRRAAPSAAIWTRFRPPLREDAPLAFQRLPLVARAGPSVRRLYWYEDGLLVASGPPGDPLFVAPRRGDHRLVVTDDLGQSDSVTYSVE